MAGNTSNYNLLTLGAEIPYWDIKNTERILGSAMGTEF